MANEEKEKEEEKNHDASLAWVASACLLVLRCCTVEEEKTVQCR